jgi:hypothetical protein
MPRVCSIFSQILRFIPRSVFESAVREHQTEKHAKGMTSWRQFIALLFCHLGGAPSLREIVGGLAASEGKLKHLGVDRAPTRSSYTRGCSTGWLGCAATKRKEKKGKFRFHHPLLTLDATVIPVCVSMFEWASHVKSKGAVKLHIMLDNASFLPQYAVIIPAMLLVRYLQLRSTWQWGLSNLVALLRQQLFVYRDLWVWINKPFHSPIALDDAQLPLLIDG